MSSSKRTVEDEHPSELGRKRRKHGSPGPRQDSQKSSVCSVARAVQSCTPASLQECCEHDESKQRAVRLAWDIITKNLQCFLGDVPASAVDASFERKVNERNMNDRKASPLAVMVCTVCTLLSYRVDSFHFGHMALFSYFLDIIGTRPRAGGGRDEAGAEERERSEGERGERQAGTLTSLWQRVLNLDYALRAVNIDEAMRTARADSRPSRRTRCLVHSSPALFVENEHLEPRETMTTVAHVFPRGLCVVAKELTGRESVNCASNLLHMFSFHEQMFDRGHLLVKSSNATEGETTEVCAERGLTFALAGKEYITQHLDLIRLGTPFRTHAVDSTFLKWRETVVRDMIHLRDEMRDDAKLLVDLVSPPTGPTDEEVRPCARVSPGFDDQGEHSSEESCTEETSSEASVERNVHRRFSELSGEYSLDELGVLAGRRTTLRRE
ncbi:hypothetical protein AB1Y20_007400 [Prymnesium parvum]|uniref:HNH nuclease domain-containing protein n=1 Tax=Prymnesium parvum TaxID=97485 RepID=A0AB34IV40_PRYPA